MPQGPGSIFTIKLKKGFKACINLVESVKLFSHVANIGITRSLIIHLHLLLIANCLKKIK